MAVWCKRYINYKIRGEQGVAVFLQFKTKVEMTRNHVNECFRCTLKCVEKKHLSLLNYQGQ